MKIIPMNCITGSYIPYIKKKSPALRNLERDNTFEHHVQDFGELSICASVIG